MPDLKLTFRLVGADADNGAVRFEDFRLFCDKVAECLRRSEFAVTRQTGKIRYRVTELKSGSAEMAIEPIAPRRRRTPDRRAEVVKFFVGTVAALQMGESIDPRITPDDLIEFRQLVAPLNRRTKEEWIENVQLTSQYVANIDKLLGTPIQSEGSVSGFLEGLNLHQRNEFILYPPLTGYRIICSFPESMWESVRAALKRNVTVYGTLFNHPDRPFPDRVHAKQLEVHPPDSELPTLGQLRGAFHGCTNGVSPVDFVRALRDEQTN